MIIVYFPFPHAGFQVVFPSGVSVYPQLHDWLPCHCGEVVFQIREVYLHSQTLDDSGMFNIKNSGHIYTDVGDVIIHACVRLNQIWFIHYPMETPYKLKIRKEHIEHSIFKQKSFPWLTCVMKDHYHQWRLKIKYSTDNVEKNVYNVLGVIQWAMSSC